MTMRQKGTVWMLVLTSTLISLGCYSSQWVHNCEVEEDCDVGHCYRGYCFTETQATKYGFSESDIVYDDESETDGSTDVATFKTADILFVVDNTFTMIEEQDELSRSVRSLIRALDKHLLKGADQTGAEPVRFAVTTTDLGLSWNGNPYDLDEPFALAPNCSERPFGDDGDMRTEYDDYIIAASRSCVSSNEWVRDDMYFEMSREGDGDTLDEDTLYKVMSCLLPVGKDGCAFEQQLSAAHRAIFREDQHAFFRPEALTVIILVTDEDDCSIKDRDWISLAEDASNPALVCGENESMLFDIDDMKTRFEAARREATGSDASDAILFAGIVGVPFDKDCLGSGKEIADCLEVGLPGGGTMADPRMVNGEGTGKTSNYALACTRYSEDGDAITQAYPATRIVKMAQAFGDMGYLASVCSDDWSGAMNDIFELIDSRMGAAISVE